MISGAALFRSSVPLLCWVCLFQAFGQSPDTVDWKTRRERLGKEDKYRFLVDKVLSRSNDWVLTATHVAEASAAGFNVISPRMGAEDLDRCRREARMAEAAGMFYTPWLRATIKAATGERFVWSNGLEQDILSPNTDLFWEQLSQIILAHARLSTEVPSMLGTFLDLENYEPDAPEEAAPFAYTYSYDDTILSAFARATGQAAVAAQPAERAGLIEARGLTEGFEDFQAGYWRHRCRELRHAIDAINPDFRLIVYPAWESPFLEKAIYPEWGTDRAPLVLAEYHTYGRRGWLRHEEALRKSEQALAEGMAAARHGGARFYHFMAGVDPLTTGADPEYCGKNASLISKLSDGYWIFYEGPRYEENHPDYFRWFARANRDIASGSFELAEEPRQEPDKLHAAAYFDPDPRKIKVAHLGLRHLLREQLRRTGKFDLHGLKGPDKDYLALFDTVLLEQYRLPPEDPWVSDLRAYVENGGGVVLDYRAAAQLAFLFPEVVQATTPDYSIFRPLDEAEREGKETPTPTPVPEGFQPEVCSMAVVGQDFPERERFSGLTEFAPVFPQRMTFEPGPEGEVLTIDCYSQATAVLGSIGQGRVVFLGTSYGRDIPAIPEGPEFEFLTALLEWAANKPD